MGERVASIDDRLKAWATPYQVRLIDAINLHGGLVAAARSLGIDQGNASKSILTLRAKAAMHGWAPDHHMTNPAPAPFLVKGTSAFFDGEGNVKGQWVKTALADGAAEEARKAALEAMAETLPRLEPIARPAFTLANLATLYTFTDYHLGAMAWRMEGGADWDLKIAERMLIAAIEQLVTGAPQSHVGIVNIQGDFLHSDSILPVTPTSHHVLDQDGRFSKIVATAIRSIRRLVDTALMRHEIVELIIAEGNHDISSSIWLRHMFAALYEDEPRVRVNVSELPYYVVQHGKTMLGFHHGHLKKNDQLPLLFAAQFPKVWGATTRRYAHCGHRHHVEEREHSGMIVVQHPTLAARDAYAARGGWIADRAASAITYHSEFGQVGRNTVCPEMLGEAA